MGSGPRTRLVAVNRESLAGMSLASADLAASISSLADVAGAAILEVYARSDPGTREKADRTPVTEADLEAERLIVAGLRELTPDIPIVAEESVAAGDVPETDDGPFWLVDPLDGTREFLSGNGEFTVNIALVEAGVPVLGVVHLPVQATSYLGGAGAATVANGPGRRDLGVVEANEAGFRVLVSRSHLDEETERWLADVPVTERISAGSSLKFCRIAEGAADLYPRFGRTMEWDTAAGQAVLLAAGGAVTTASGAPLRYGKPGFANPSFLAFGATAPQARGDVETGQRGT